MLNRRINEITNTQARSTNYYTTVAKVISCKEHQNECTLELTDHYGELISVNAFTESDFFPAPNTLVKVNCYQNNYTITGPYYNTGALEANAKKETKTNSMYYLEFAISEGNIL